MKTACVAVYPAKPKAKWGGLGRSGVPLVTRGRDYRRSRQKSHYIKVHPRIQHFLQPTYRHDHLAEASLPELLQLKFLFIELLQPLILPAPTDKMGTPPKREAQILSITIGTGDRKQN